MMANDVEQQAIAYSMRYLETQAYQVDKVSGKRGHRGYDLLARRQDQTLKIEVKGCTRPWGIPDPYVTEFDEARQLVADFLYVVYLLEGTPPFLCAIPRAAINPDYIKPKSGYRISHKFKKESVMGKFVVCRNLDE